MAAAPSIAVKKNFLFKGGNRIWSNRYHFLGGTPADATHWHTLMDAVTAAEKLALTPLNTIVEAVGYAAGSDVPVASKVYSIAGTCALDTGHQAQAGEVATLLRFSTNARTTKNHPIYCFNYYHGVYTTVTTGDADLLQATQKAAMLTFGNDWIAGFSDGTLTLTRCSPNGAACLGAIVEEYVTHRDFPYQTSV